MLFSSRASRTRSLPCSACVRAAGFFIAVAITLGSAAPMAARAASNTSALAGTVTSDSVPVAGAAVTASGNNVTVRATSDRAGHFSFPSLGYGTYEVKASSGGRTADTLVNLGSGGATFTLALSALKLIGKVTVVRNSTQTGSGADVTIDSKTLTRGPASDSFPETLIQLPGTARGANGVVHMNGDHGVIDYVVDGVPLPQALNREIGSEIDPNDVSFVDAEEGAYPAQYGLRFGGVLNITTRAGSGPAGFDGDVHYGSYNNIDQTLGYHAPIAGGGGFDVAIRDQQSTRALDPPDFDSAHNSGSETNQFARVTLPAGPNAFTDISLVHSFRTTQIPVDTQFGEPAGTDDSETQGDTFLSIQERRTLANAGSITFGPAIKVSRVQDFGDPKGDFAYGEALNTTPAPFGNGGTPTDCATALQTGNYGPTTCGFSLNDDKTSLDYILQGDVVKKYGHHEIKAGVNYDATRVLKNYSVTLQPDNFLAPILTPNSPDAPVTVADRTPNVGNTYQSYVQDTWKLSPRYTVDYGLRYDFFNIRSVDFADGFGAFSPRLKLTRTFGARASIYGYVGRFFEPFSFENVDPEVAHELNLPLQSNVAQFDLQPERDTQLEFGGHVPAGEGEVGFRIWQKNANNLIDDTQVGVTQLHQDINYTLGRLSAETIDYTLPLVNDGRAYVNVNHTISLNEGCETQLLAPCYGSPTIFTPADHEQRWSITGGILSNDAHGGWISADGEYGSGLSSAVCMPASDDCKATPHTIFAVEKGFAVKPKVAVTLRVQNLLNDRYYVTLLNAQGNHYAPPRTFDVGVRFGR